ncbi:hypothetical protein [Legionella fairfieldensis]|uniref:hypothetical protein n=1 Tax=Legionella fairfieldensis TaxID=45064 RepID=UPI0005652FDC|nr:hypothetical protein [Legionella fairfieldensis]
MNNDRYDVIEDENFEPGSHQQVLRNYLGIKDKQTIEVLEEQELERTGLQMIDLYDKIIDSIHRIFVISILYGLQESIHFQESTERPI